MFAVAVAFVVVFVAVLVFMAVDASLVTFHKRKQQNQNRANINCINSDPKYKEVDTDAADAATGAATCAQCLKCLFGYRG